FLLSKEDLALKIQKTLGKNMELLSDELRMMKGSVMKAGQMLSLFAGDILPPELKHLLTQLQSESHYLDWEEIKKQINPKILSEIDFDIEPFAAASIGQVHLGVVKKTGEKVAVKIQYPGVKKAIDHDVTMLKLLIRMTKMLPKSIDSK